MILALGVRNALSCVCVVVARVCFVDALSELPTKTHKGNAQKRKQPNTYTDPTGPSTEPPIQTTPTSNTITPKPNQNHTHTTHHTTPPTTKHTNKKPKKTQNGDKGESRRGEGKKEERREKEEEKGEGEKHKTGARGNRTPDLLHRQLRRALTSFLPLARVVLIQATSTLNPGRA